MSAKSYMILGAIGGVAAMFISSFQPFGEFVIFAFASGAIFGKGYGIWEERSRRPRP